MGLNQYEMNRRGKFVVRTYGESHCGLLNDLTIEYHVRVVCEEDSLDDRGFLFDQMSIKHFFEALDLTDLSCEKLCLYASRALYRRIMQQNGSCHIISMEVMLSPEPHEASMTYRYHRGMPKHYQ